ncbi:acetaldehyde dehydrogenase (acetylating) [Thermolongibacillus altinsuensis]|uniref:acetaldehyde dehydrogenase (acetylating) n=1 Tax=Thermolongibacillus altinsuensis TaxID=575256 RepID=UPI00242A3122|nr:acetaldehyde dehydrogenase (acetylating) [Thermolongibacillus altinsuensis]GMB09479.1 acetaldehyde dehydrogenase (acetylating) [Thermolongibacillus altinsuensis]
MQFDHDLQSIQEMRDAVKRAKEAQQKYLSYTQEQVDEIVKRVADATFSKSLELAKMAVEETGMGIIEHKKIKNEVASRAVYESIKNEKTVGIIKEDKINKVIEVAYPFGVIAGIIPTTNPTSTAIFKTLIALKTRNAIVISPHPRAVNCTIEALKISLKEAVEAGAPEGIIGWISKPSMSATSELMKHRDVDLILATGGGGLVRAAYSSGKPAYGVGPGNVPVYIEKTAHVAKAVKMIVDSKTFDNGTICATEQAIIVDQNIKQMAIRELKNNGAYFLNEEEKAAVEKIISPTLGTLNPNIVGQSAEKIANMAGISVPAETRLIIAEETRVGKDVPFSIEKLSPIFPLYTANSYEEAKELCLKILNLGGRGHTLSLHTNDDEIAKDFALEMPVSRVLVNTLSSIGAVGATTELIPSLTLGCGSFGGNITSDNITARHLINIKRMAYGTKEVSLPKPSQSINVNLENKKKQYVEEIIEEVVKKMKPQEKVDSAVISKLVNEIINKYQTN